VLRRNKVKGVPQPNGPKTGPGGEGQISSDQKPRKELFPSDADATHKCYIS
jgi:hypothetical protein